MSMSKADVSLRSIADKLVTSTRRLMRSAKTEEDLRIGFEKILAPLLESAGIESKARYERLSSEARSIYRGRPDAVHGQVIIEYERPSSFTSKRKVTHAYDQLVDYITAEIKGQSKGATGTAGKAVGVGFDGSSVFFVQCLPDKNNKGKKKRNLSFIMRGPWRFNSESAFTLVTYLRALARLPLTAENLADQFGPQSEIAQKTVSAFVDALTNWSTQRAADFLNEWRRLFGIVYGEQFGAAASKEGQALAEVYGIKEETDFQAILFCVHTYFALLMKLIAAELLTLEETSFISSFSSKMVHVGEEELEVLLTDMEDGGIYAKRGITNFLEGDFFRWYIEALSSPRVGEAIRDMARSLSEFEPATPTIDPDATRDLLKKLYQYLVPEIVRHNLGEYYTPDWLAELVLNEVRYDGNTQKRLLDPACGSGTFLVLAIQRARAYARESGEPAVETLKRIVGNIWGFDLNPLAVIAARTNYLFALGDLVYQLPSLEIPVYLADSVLWPERAGQMLLRVGQSVEVRTSIRPFFVPKIWVEKEGFQMKRAAPVLEELAKLRCTPAEALKRFKKEGLVFPPHEKTVIRFYEQILELEKEGRNGIWARFLKNAFAPMMAEQFDFVVGNPPWIRWGYLSDEYRKATFEMWKEYGLFSLKGHAARLGGGEKDFSMLFTYAAADYYLSKTGKLGFLITQEVFKSKGAGEGFRKFRLGDREPLKILKAHDLVTVQPFERAANKTAAIFLRKGTKTEYPVSYTVWKRRKGLGKIRTDLSLDEALPLLEKTKLIANPMGKPNGAWQTIRKNQRHLGKIQGENEYKARRGASTEPYGVFWLEVAQLLSDGNLIVHNLPERGKVKIRKVEEVIEADLVFPAVCGADIIRWGVCSEIYVLITQDPEKRKGYPERVMKDKWQRTFNYVSLFKSELRNRASYKKYHDEIGNPFYSQYNIADYTFARYKTVWKRMANDIVGAVISQAKTPFGYKKIIPTDTTALFSTEDINEAHYLCAIINSTVVRDFIKSYSSAGRGFGAPSVMDHVGIHKFNIKNTTHKKLSELSKTLHKLKSKSEDTKILKLEKQVDQLVYKLFGLPDIR